MPDNSDMFSWFPFIKRKLPIYRSKFGSYLLGLEFLVRILLKKQHCSAVYLLSYLLWVILIFCGGGGPGGCKNSFQTLSSVLSPLPLCMSKRSSFSIRTQQLCRRCWRGKHNVPLTMIIFKNLCSFIALALVSSFSQSQFRVNFKSFDFLV